MRSRLFLRPVALAVNAATVAVITLMLPENAAAQDGAVRGRVRLAGSDLPVAAAAVVVVGTGLGAITTDDGSYTIADIPAGLYTIEARRIGTSVEHAEAVVRAGQVTIVEFELLAAPSQLVGVSVVGERSDALARLPGSAAVLTARELVLRQPVSANEVLKSIPGIHIQEEEGLGLRANIGIRGLDPDRSRTVLVLEDGVPVALAPYGEPEMYYSPPIERMERLEVVKGSGSIAYGPQTIGGVINYVTADAPVQPTGRLELHGGDGSYLLAKLAYGGTWGSARGNIGAFHKQADDLNGLFFDITDVTAKIGFTDPDGRSDVGLKLSLYDEISNSTYVGLTDSIYRASPHIHPAPGDRLRLSRYAAVATHSYALGAATTLRTNVYAYETTRNWQRRDYIYTANDSNYVFLNSTGNRNRTFDVAGIEPRLTSQLSIGGMRGQLDAGVRVHYERARDQHINGSTATSYTGEIRDDEIRTGRAISGFVHHRFHLTEALTVTPGLRAERFDYDRHVLRTRVRREAATGSIRRPEDVDIRTSDAISELIPGIGAAWSSGQHLTIYAGAHRGFAPPRVKDALIYEDPVLAPGEQVPAPVSLQLDAERSWNYELGARVRPAPYLAAEATLFYLDFANQIVEPSLSAGSVAQAALANQGATLHRGIEAGASIDLAKLIGQPFGLTAEGGITLVDARFSGERLLTSADGDTLDIDGNRLPYAPRYLAHAALTFEHPSGAAVRLDGTWVGEQFTDNFETEPGSANGRTGRIPPYGVIDLSAHYRLPLPTRLTLTTSVKNALDETYIASRRPEGIKVALPRLASVGVRWTF